MTYQPVKADVIPGALDRVTVAGLLKALGPLPGVDKWVAEIYYCIASRRGGWVSRDTIAEEIYGGQEDGGPLFAPRNVSVAVFRLRKAGYKIATAYGRGYAVGRK